MMRQSNCTAGLVIARTHMHKFRITLVRPPAYVHTESFREIAETLQFGLQALGHAAQISENLFESGCRNVILGAHLLTSQQMQNVPSGSIIYNLEQIGGAQLNPAYYALAKQHQIWDYDVANIEKWNTLGCSYKPIHVPIGYAPELTRINSTVNQDIDVLFYGSLNERRTRILSALRNAGLNVHNVFGIYGKQRDELIARAKLVLNVHFYESKVFEIVRVSYLLANAKAVVSECSPGLETAIACAPYEDLMETCRSLVQDEKRRKEQEARGFQWFSQRKEKGILKSALQQTSNQESDAKATDIPRKLNMGSGKDWREDYFNVDFDPYWEPDAVLDFNRPLPIGEPLDSPRFGHVVLKNEWFDEIVANDCLEHISNLTMAMTSCLNLLREGGLFRISVPYDLSWGAWQDPTHVRAFNERSWLYYTDWFWYMGWTEARFDLVQFDLGLSPIGQQLAVEQVKGEDLVRHPRAVDQLKVTLRKRPLTDAEKQQVGAYLKRPNRAAGHKKVASVKTQGVAVEPAPVTL